MRDCQGHMSTIIKRIMTCYVQKYLNRDLLVDVNGKVSLLFSITNGVGVQWHEASTLVCLFRIFLYSTNNGWQQKPNTSEFDPMDVFLIEMTPTNRKSAALQLNAFQKTKGYRNPLQISVSKVSCKSIFYFIFIYKYIKNFEIFFSL